MKKKIIICFIFLFGTISLFGISGCKIKNKENIKNEDNDVDFNKDSETLYKIMLFAKKDFKKWLDNKKIIDISNNSDNVSEYNNFITNFKKNETKTFIGKEIEKISFLNNLVNDFKNEFVIIKNKIVNNYNNFYLEPDKKPPIYLDENEISLKINKVNFDNLSKIITNNEEELNAIIIEFNFKYLTKFKETEQSQEVEELIIITNNIVKLNNIQNEVKLWFVKFVDDLFKLRNNKIIDNSDNNFNKIGSNNSIWLIIKEELERKGIVTNYKPYFAEFFNFLNLNSVFKRDLIALEWTGEGYNSEKITLENFLEFYKRKNNFVVENDYYVKANVMEFLPGNFMIENLPFKDRNSKKIRLNNLIKILILKEKVDRQLNEFSEKVINFWKYYKLETYDNKIVLNIKKSDFEKILKNINLIKKNDSLNIKIYKIFTNIFNCFNDNYNSKLEFNLSFNDNMSFNIDEQKNISDLKIKIMDNNKKIEFKLFRNFYFNGNYSIYYLNFSYNDFAYSFLINPDKWETNRIDIDYSFFQIIEFKLN